MEAIMGILARYQWYRYSIIVTDFDNELTEFLEAAEKFEKISTYNKTYAILFNTFLILIIICNILNKKCILNSIRFEILSMIKLKRLRRSKNIDLVKLKLKAMSLETRVIILHCHM